MEVKTEVRQSLHQYPGLMDDGQPVAAKSAFSYVPTYRDSKSPELNAFNSFNHNHDAVHSTYDQLFNQPDGYNNKLHRCDREHAKLRGLHVNKEEKTKTVPTLSSSVYGHKLKNFKDPPGRKHASSERPTRLGMDPCPRCPQDTLYKPRDTRSTRWSPPPSRVPCLQDLVSRVIHRESSHVPESSLTRLNKAQKMPTCVLESW